MTESSFDIQVSGQWLGGLKASLIHKGHSNPGQTLDDPVKMKKGRYKVDMKYVSSIDEFQVGEVRRMALKTSLPRQTHWIRKGRMSKRKKLTHSGLALQFLRRYACAVSQRLVTPTLKQYSPSLDLKTLLGVCGTEHWEQLHSLQTMLDKNLENFICGKLKGKTTSTTL